MAPVQGANTCIDNLGNSFRFSTHDCTCMLSTIMYDEAILISTHNIQFHDKIRKNN